MTFPFSSAHEEKVEPNPYQVAQNLLAGSLSLSLSLSRLR